MSQPGSPVDAPAVDPVSPDIQHLLALIEADPSRVKERARELLEESAREPRQFLLLATALRRQGNVDAAYDILSLLVEREPAMAGVHYELGLVFIARRQHGDATRHLTQAVELDPGNAAAWSALGDQLLRMRRQRHANAAYAQAYMASEENPKLRDVIAHLQKRRFDNAERLLNEVLAADPDNAKALKLMAELCIHADKLAAAEKLLARCLVLAPDFVKARYRYATVLLMRNKPRMTLAQLDELEQQDPNQPSYRTLRADALASLGEFELARSEFEALLKNDPEQPAAWMDYGHLLNVTGGHEEAIRAFRKCIELIPGHGEAYWRLANYKDFRFAESEVEGMHAQMARPALRDDNRSYFHFALGKALEDEGQWRAAFEQYRKANELLRPSIAYDASATSDRVKRAKAFFTADLFARRASDGFRTAGPIFVVGLPRAGSSLLEQILASHTAVQATGGLQAIARMAAGLAGKAGRSGSGENYPEILGAFDEQELRILGEEYFKRGRTQLDPHRLYFVDRTPDNFLHVGFIQLILPEAKIVDVRRHPLGCCFSNYRYHYGHDRNFSYSLSDLGRYYSDYVELMAHFDDVLPGRVHRIFYEALVENPERQIRRLLEYLGLQFEDQCLRFFENPRPVQSFAAQQVRMPIYREAVDRWKHFEPWLGALKDALGFVLHAYPDAPSFYGRLHATLSQTPSGWGNEHLWSARLQEHSEIAAGMDA